MTQRSRGTKCPSEASQFALKTEGRREHRGYDRTRGSHAKRKRHRYAETPALPAQWFTAYTRSPRSTAGVPGLLASVPPGS
jgi:hypothetical protein